MSGNTMTSQIWCKDCALKYYGLVSDEVIGITTLEEGSWVKGWRSTDEEFCFRCARTLSDGAKLLKMTRPLSMTCRRCLKVFTSLDELGNHKMNVEECVAKEGVDEDVECGSCGFRGGRHSDSCQDHVPEAVDHPRHYGGKHNPYEAIKVIEAWGLGFCLGNTVKYISRYGRKDPAKTLEDLKKAKWYLDRKVANLEKNK